MKRQVKIPIAIAASLLLAFALMPQPEAPFTGHGNVEALSNLYNRWKTAYEQQGDAQILRIGLNYSKAQSHELTAANGQASVNLVNGQLQVAATGLSGQQQYEVWLLDKHDSSTPGNKAIKIGALSASADKHLLTTRLDREQLSGFTLDTVAIAKAGETPQSGGVLFGSPGLLQRIYYNERFLPTTTIGSAAGNAGLPSKPNAPFEFLLPKMAQAGSGHNSISSATQLTNLIARGQKIFTEETFEGNGRTCATCHRPDRNHTIDPIYITKLPKTDPLFVAETNPALANLEKPALLRQFGLFVANADGFDRPPVMRSAPHLLGLSASLVHETTSMGGEFTQDQDYYNEHDPIAAQTNRQTQAIGWSGDGAPDGGSLRDFAKGAIKQHLPKTLNRADNVDFRMPTEDELDALEAYMLSLGRSTDINLAAITFNSPLVQKGLLLFNTKNNPGETLTGGYPTGGTPTFGTTANCNGCHMNAGAFSSTTGANPTRDTGVERMRDQLHHLADTSVSYDGGFGQVLQNDCGPNYDQACYSDESLDPRGIRPSNHQRLNRFNTPSLIEAADTGPFFHNNSITTLEETVAYYNTEAFNQSPGAFTAKGINRQVKLDSSQVIAVAMFLRSINVLENIRSSNQLDQTAIGQNDLLSQKTLVLAMADTQDAIRVLQEAVINPYPDALVKLTAALDYENQAVRGFSFSGRRQALLRSAITLKNQARALIASGS
jgi:hypothetical protein